MRFQLSTRFNLQTEARKQAYFNKGNNENSELTLQAASEKPAKPRFVFTHLMLPHYPYYFDHDGRARIPFESLQEENSMIRRTTSATCNGPMANI